MRKRNYMKFGIDLAMVLVFALLFNKMVLGMAFHEIAGLAIGGVVVVHLVLNRKWIKGITMKFFSKSVAAKTRLGYMLTILLLLDFIVIIGTGIFISKVVFVDIISGGLPIFKTLHVSASYFALLLVGLHLGLKWTWVMAIFRKMVKLPETKAVTYIGRSLAVLVLISGLYCVQASGFVNKIQIQTGGGDQPAMAAMVETAENAPTDSDSLAESDSAETANGTDISEDSDQASSSDAPQGNPPDRAERSEHDQLGERPEGGPDRGGSGNGISTNPLQVSATYLGVIAAFAVITYYLDKGIARLKP